VAALSAPLPFTLGDLRSAIPPHCFRPSTTRSLAYFAGDCGLLASLYVVAFHFDAWPVQVLAPLAIGSVMFSLKVIGHDCGHGSFSRLPRLNSCVGHFTNTLLFVPYHGWRLSHAIHHRFAGDIDRDEGWHPLTETQYAEMPRSARWVRLNGVLFVFPLYLWRRTWGRTGSHFDADGSLFSDADRSQVRVSAMWCALWGFTLVGLVGVFGPGAVATYYFAPYLVFVFWMDLVTYLHHTDPDVPWRRGNGWDYVRGALATVDRNYGWLDSLHHHIGTHVVHHLFPAIPHYHLREATRAIRPVLGGHYRRAEGSVAASLLRAIRGCRVVPDSGDVVYYATSPAGSGSRPSTSR
jgi:omega-3 fatty acid desaturase (delta-15 desaturase)